MNLPYKIGAFTRKKREKKKKEKWKLVLPGEQLINLPPKNLIYESLPRIFSLFPSYLAPSWSKCMITWELQDLILSLAAFHSPAMSWAIFTASEAVPNRPLLVKPTVYSPFPPFQPLGKGVLGMPSFVKKSHPCISHGGKKKNWVTSKNQVGESGYNRKDSFLGLFCKTNNIMSW